MYAALIEFYWGRKSYNCHMHWCWRVHLLLISCTFWLSIGLSASQKTCKEFSAPVKLIDLSQKKETYWSQNNMKVFNTQLTSLPSIMQLLSWEPILNCVCRVSCIESAKGTYLQSVMCMCVFVTRIIATLIFWVLSGGCQESDKDLLAANSCPWLILRSPHRSHLAINSSITNGE